MRNNKKYKAFIEKLYKEQHSYFFRISNAILNHPTDAEDAVSEAFYKISNNIERIFRLPCHERLPYCVKIVKNASYDIVRKRKESLYDIHTLDRMKESPADIFEELAEKIGREELGQILLELSPLEFLLIKQRYYEMKSFREIAEVLDVNEAAARKRHQRILAKIRKLYEERGAKVNESD